MSDSAAATPPRPTLGLLMLQTRFPRPPGDVGHPATFSCPVLRRVVAGALPSRVVRAVPDPALVQPFVDAARALVAEGAAAIGTSCGFLALWQRPLQAALPVPVWTSSLLALGAELAHLRCGVVTVCAGALTGAHFAAVGADPATPVEGIADGSALQRTLLGDLPELDAADAAAQVVAAGRRLQARRPELQAIVLECTNFPPYAPALRRATGLPVHDVVTLLSARMAALDGRPTTARMR